MGDIVSAAAIPILHTQTFVYTHTSIMDSELNSTILRIPTGQLKTTEFRHFLAKRIPLVITDLNSKLQLSWSPSHLIRDYGADMCSLEDCEEKEKPVKKHLKIFLARFMNTESKLHDDNTQDVLPEAVWRIKVRM
jgi:hypothetical protein